MNYLYTLLVMAAIDSVWLYSTGSFYRRMLSHIFVEKFNFFPAIIFYLLYAFGVFFFVISPAIKNGSSGLTVFLTGALFGLIAYATYDLTNQATIVNWPVTITLIDLAWGSFLTGLVSFIVFNIHNYLK